MGIFQRLGDLLKSNVNDLIDKAEDPEKMVKQIIIDMQQELNKSTQALGKAVSSERIAKKQYEDCKLICGKFSQLYPMPAEAFLHDQCFLRKKCSG